MGIKELLSKVFPVAEQKKELERLLRHPNPDIARKAFKLALACSSAAKIRTSECIFAFLSIVLASRLSLFLM